MDYGERTRRNATKNNRARISNYKIWLIILKIKSIAIIIQLGKMRAYKIETNIQENEKNVHNCFSQCLKNSY